MRAGRPTAALAVHTRRPSHASKPPSRRHHLRMPRARGPLLRAAAAALEALVPAQALAPAQALSRASAARP